MRAILLLAGAVLLATPSHAGRKEKTETVTLMANQVSVWHVDGVEVGRGKFLDVEVAADVRHEITAQAEGYRAKSDVISPPYDSGRARRITFMVEDRVGASAPVRAARVTVPPTQTAALPTLEAPQTTMNRQNDWAVVIGIDEYRDELPNATHAENDARAFADHAVKTLGIPSRQVRALVGNRAGLADVNSMLDEWLPRNVLDGAGTVYVYFSGHGAPDPNTGNTYLLPWDGDPAYLSSRGIEVKDLYRRLEALPAERVVVFLDACFAGSGARSVLPKGLRPVVPVSLAEAPPKLVALTASGAKETTGPAPDVSHGLFTAHLLRGLAGEADVDSDNSVRMDELASYVKDRVAKDARLDNRDQVPTLKTTGDVDLHALTLLGAP